MLSRKEIEKIIEDEIIVDCYTDEEVALGWAIYMEDKIDYPFEAEWAVKLTSGDYKKALVKVVRNISNESNYQGGEYLVEVSFEGMLLPAKLSDLKRVKAENGTLQAIEVWKYQHAGE